MSEFEAIYSGRIEIEFRNKIILKIGLVAFVVYCIAILIMSIPMIIIMSPWISSVILTVISIFSVIFAIVVGCILALAFVYYGEYVDKFSFFLTKKHIEISHGVFTQTTAVIPYTRIQNFNTINGVFDRMFNIATLQLETAGAAMMLGRSGPGYRPEGHIPGLRDPKMLIRKIKETLGTSAPKSDFGI